MPTLLNTGNSNREIFSLKRSRERAESVKAYLTGEGISAGRLQAKGYGSARPVDSNDTPAGRQNNRRTEYEIIGN